MPPKRGRPPKDESLNEEEAQPVKRPRKQRVSAPVTPAAPVSVPFVIETPPQRRAAKKKLKYTEQDTSDEEKDIMAKAPTISRKKSRPALLGSDNDVEKAFKENKRKLKRNGLKPSKSMPNLGKEASSSTSINAELTMEQRMALLHPVKWSVPRLSNIVWTFVSICLPTSTATASTSKAQSRFGVWWPAENLSYNEDDEMTREPVRLRILAYDSNSDISKHIQAVVSIEQPSPENILPFRSEDPNSPGKHILTVSPDTFRVLPQPSSPAASPRAANQDNLAQSLDEVDADDYLPDEADFKQARIAAMIRENDLSGMPDLEVAAQLALEDEAARSKAKKRMKLIYDEPTEEDLELLDVTLRYPERVIANWPQKKQPRYYPARIVGHELPKPIVPGERRTRNSLMVRYLVQWPLGFVSKANKKPDVFRHEFFTSTQPEFATVPIEKWATKYEYTPEDIVEQVHTHISTLQRVINGQYPGSNARHHEFLSVSSGKRSQMAKNYGMFVGEYSQAHREAVQVFLTKWVTKTFTNADKPIIQHRAQTGSKSNANVEETDDGSPLFQLCLEREDGCADFEALDVSNKEFYTDAVIFPTTLELLVIEDSKKPEKESPTATETTKDIRELAGAEFPNDADRALERAHELASEELQKPYWIKSIETERSLLAGR